MSRRDSKGPIAGARGSHACASRVLAEGLSIREIRDHLGHRSAATTSIHAKVNLAALREVSAIDLGGLQ
ncbi:site-specific recombinase XerD [Sinorhizobium kostiense]|uniref:Site-specific recombinase XerD n=1 Tax=Sinorhizobium kostiense TaxID=76747 RepID=A0ABS4R1I4_9HYPH|nr:site-specific recombinase XerD [Sinorhizobium kostiense]